LSMPIVRLARAVRINVNLGIGIRIDFAGIDYSNSRRSARVGSSSILRRKGPTFTHTYGPSGPVNEFNVGAIIEPLVRVDFLPFVESDVDAGDPFADFGL
jgi:hypothetical protein